MNQLNIIEIQNISVYGQLIFHKGTKTMKWGKENGSGRGGHHHAIYWSRYKPYTLHKH